MDQNRAEGSFDEAAGKLKQAAGDVTGDTKTQAEGIVDQATAKLQAGYGRARESFSDVIDDMSTRARSAAAVAQRELLGKQ